MAWINLGRILDKKKLSNRKFAELLGVKPTRVSRVFQPGFDPSFSTVVKWAAVLNVKVSDLIDESLSEQLIPRPQSAIKAIEFSAEKKGGRNRKSKK